MTVAFAQQGSQLVYLQGDVAKPGAILLAPETNRVASLLSAAIAGQALPEQTQVTVRRGSMSASARLSDIMERPDQSIALLPGDFVTVRNLQGAVSVLGASGAQGRVKISKAGYSVLDAVADSRGLSDTDANPSAVYLMQLGNRTALASGAPKVFHFDFRNPAQIALASSFVLNDGDVIMVGNASFVQTRKVLTTFNGLLAAARTAVVIAQ